MELEIEYSPAMMSMTLKSIRDVHNIINALHNYHRNFKLFTRSNGWRVEFEIIDDEDFETWKMRMFHEEVP